MNTPTIKTERLILRKFAEDDLTALYEIYSDKEVKVVKEINLQSMF